MKEVIVKGKSIKEICTKWAENWNCTTEELQVEVIQKPTMLDKNWRIKITFPTDRSNSAKARNNKTGIVWDGVKYDVFPGQEVHVVVPFPMAGKLMFNGKEMFDEFEISKGESFEYYPLVHHGDFSWELKICENGSKALAKVRHEQPGQFVLNEEGNWKKRWFLERNVVWKESSWLVKPETEKLFRGELEQQGIKYGVKPDSWAKMIAVQGTEEILIAEQVEPIHSLPSKIEDFQSEEIYEIDAKEPIDYFAAKIIICEKDDVIAKKIIGQDGIPGFNIFGEELPFTKPKDIELKAVKNVYLTEDGLELRASLSGAPLKLKNNSYAVENVCKVDQDVSLQTGNIEFPGDVLITKNVMEGLRVTSSGRVNVNGIVSGAKLKAEGGLNVGNNVFNSNIIVGERHYNRSNFLKKLKEFELRLQQFITQLEEIRQSANNPNIPFKILFRTVLEKKYKDLTLKAEEMSRLTQMDDEDFLSREIIAAIHTIKYFVVGMGPNEIKDDHYLITSLREITQYLLSKGVLVPENVVFIAGYVQTSDIKCSGDFVCKRDVFNSSIKVDGNIKIHGVCRGSKLTSGMKIWVHELGSSDGIGENSVYLPPTGKLRVEYCHTNIAIYIGNQHVVTDQPVQKLDAYLEKGKIVLDKLKWEF